jgi:hypothetical protein
VENRNPLVKSRLETQSPEILATLGAWVTFCVALLFKAPVLFEADDYAYRASIVALRNGLITLTPSQYAALNSALKGNGAFGIYQWTHLSNGNWISEKNPGFAFLAEPFYFFGNLRVAPAFYALLAVTGLYLGARRWIGPWAGFVASVCFLFTGASLAYGYRVTMPTFTEACLVAAALGLVVWSINNDFSERGKGLASSLGFVLLGAAVFSRYTNAVIYLSVLAFLIIWRKQFKFRLTAIVSWLIISAMFVTLILVFDKHFYGGWFKTGYAGQSFSTSLGNFPKNISQISGLLVEVMPVLIVAVLGAVKVLRTGKGLGIGGPTLDRIDRKIGLLLIFVVVTSWGLYFGYDRTAFNLSSGAALHVVRFYTPVLGALALLATWQLMKFRWRIRTVVLTLLVLCAFWSFSNLTKQTPPAPGQPGGAPLWSVTR